MKFTNKHNLPDAIVRAVTRDPYDRGDAEFSVSEIIDSPRVKALLLEYDDEIEEDVADRIFSLFGTAVHSVLERGTDKGEVAEERLFYTLKIDGTEVTVSGAMDNRTVGDKVGITDWKVTSVWTFGADKPGWPNQQNCYAHLVRNAQWAERWIDGEKIRYKHIPREVSSLRIGAILRDWSAGKAKRDPKYPPVPMQVLDLPLWSPEEAEAYFTKRVRMHIKARSMLFAGLEPPDCTAEERWEDAPVYAVVKEGGKRALGLYDTKKEAQAHVNDAKVKLSIDVRGGTPKRCEDWCKVAPYCNQYKRIKEERVE